ncbi:MAG TPA: fatty acid desaturase [Longimicrobiaceae bacterium]|nr:fatty acid desaturase [Longimicrobiaceae bacterium]
MHGLTLLYKEFTALGFTQKRPGRVIGEMVFHLLLALGGTAVFIWADPLGVRVAGLLAMTLGNLGIATSTHTSSHNATSDRLWVNKALTFFGYPFMFGASAMYWYTKHIAVHHPTPNVIGLDDDVDLLPWFALTEEEFNQGGPLRRLYYRHQWVLVPLAIALNHLNLTYTSLRYLAGALRDPRGRSRMHWIDVGVVLSHYALWIGVPLLFFPVQHVLGFYLLRSALMGYAMFAGFAPAHFPVEASFLPMEGHSNRAEYKRNSDYILLQTATTVNFRTGWFGRLLCAGVDYQIEHHLFPGISHVYYPQMSVVLQRFCAENGYPYRTLGWGEALWKSLMAFRHPKPVEPALEALRLRVAAQYSDAAALQPAVVQPAVPGLA